MARKEFSSTGSIAFDRNVRMALGRDRTRRAQMLLAAVRPGVDGDGSAPAVGARIGEVDLERAVELA